MGYSIKDLENAAKNIGDQLEARSQRRADEIAGRLMARASTGRGLWFLVLWPAWLLIFGFSSTLFWALLLKMEVREPFVYAGIIGGFLFACAWYSWEFTVRHPFWSSVVGYFGTLFGVLFLGEKLSLLG